MPRLRSAEQALQLFANGSRQQYICRTCRAHAIRQFHSSQYAAAELPFFKRIQQTLFGSQEAREAERKREEKAQQQIQELAKRDESGLRTKKVGKTVYRIAPVVDPSVNTDYVPSTTWDGLERVGSREYVKKKADQGETYIGYGDPESPWSGLSNV